MRRFPLTLIALCCCGLLVSGLPTLAFGATEPSSPEALLLQQIQVGEYHNRSDIVEQALYRLELIDPQNPDLIAAKIRLSLRQKNLQKAQEELNQLKQLAPDSDAYKQAQISMELNSESGQEKLQNIRLLATTGHLQEAKAAYDELFHNNPPPVDLAVDYWQLVSRLPGQRAAAIQQLQNIERKTPGSPKLRTVLAGLLFDNNDTEKGFALLQLMAADSSTQDAAAMMWLDQISSLPVSRDSVAKLQLFLTFYADNAQYAQYTQQARALLEQQQGNLANPAFIARQTALTTVNRGNNVQAIPELRKALTLSPDDVDLTAALASAYDRQGNRAAAITYYERANKLDNNSGKWNDDINENRYWLLIQQGDDALAKNQPEQALAKYRQARSLNSRDTEALMGLGNVAVAQRNDETAIGYYQQILRMEPNNLRALNKLVDIYQSQSPEKALAYLNSLPYSQKTRLNATLASVRSNILQKEAEILGNQSRWPDAITKLKEAQSLTPNDVWLTYHLARALQASGNVAEADNVLQRLATRQGHDPEFVYAYALYLSGSGRTEQAIQRLAQLPKARWTTDLVELEQRLERDKVLETAQKLRETEGEMQAIAYLNQQAPNERIDATLADWASERGDYQTALSLYQKMLAHSPDNTDAMLGEIEAYIALGEKNIAREKLMYWENKPADSLNMARRIANAWLAIDKQKGDARYQALRNTLASQPLSADSALVWRDMARAEHIDDPQHALDDYKYAMVASGITNALPTNDDDFTRLTRSKAEDDWLKRSIRSDTADLYQQHNTIVTLDTDYWGSSGTKGISDLTAQTTMLEMETPLYDGKFFARTDYVYMNAGKFSAEGDGHYYEKFGACYEVGCDSDFNQKASGTSFALGWRDDKWNMDVGTTPFGFDVVDWVGGINYKTDFWGLGWTFTASRRPISSSLLSFSGTKDPATGTTWGGVRATGGGIGLSYDEGEANGIWADLSAHELTGKHVEDNNRVRLMAGYYRRLINEVDREVTIGLNSMLWRYNKDLSGYTLGHGGYYSPQRYFSLAVPLTYRQRTENWSWELAGSVSWSTSSTDSQHRYPIRNLVSHGIPDANVIESGDSGSGFGYTARALVERRLSSHWSIGAGVDIQEAKNYTPSHALLYLRYSFDSWRGNMTMPPRPLIPYADFK